MSLDTLAGRPASELAVLVQTRQVTPYEVVAAHLARLASCDARVGAFQTARGERALAEARALESLNVMRLPLAGVPVAIKDNIDVDGEPTRNGTPATPDRPARHDHEMVRRLCAAGAIVIGKTRVPDLSAWATTDGSFGVARNPWDLARTAGGSSGGSAAAVAMGMVPVAHGTDGLGSIRIPAAACGVIGIKPGKGLLPSEIGASNWFGMAENGLLATTVDDAALVLSVMASDPSIALVPAPSARLRIALSMRSPLAGTRLDPEYVRAAAATGEALAAAGHRVTRVDPVYPMRAALAVMARWCAGTAEDAAGLDVQSLPRRTRGHVRAGWWCRRLGAIRPQDQATWRTRAAAFFRNHDVLLTPALAQLPLPADGWVDRSWAANVLANIRWAPFAAAWNLAGFPAASVPASMHPAGVPLAVQIVVPPGGERTLLAVAKQIEAARPWPRHAPMGRG